ncbi:MAG: nucleotidyltransferase family protein [Prevotella sp.]|nr:nucleotidyltransferase family protein [Prevotella sp.]
MTTEEILFECLKSSLWGRTLSFSRLDHDQYEGLVEMAMKQTVFGLVGDALLKESVKLERLDAIHLYADIQKIESESDHINLELCRFARALTKRGIEYTIVKGQVMAALYPHPKMRMSGDVDMYFVGEYYDRTKKFVEQKLKVSLDKFTDGKHVEFNVHKVTFELHNKLSQFASRKHQAYWDKMIDEGIGKGVSHVDINDMEIATLRGTFNALYIFVHLFFHMTASGLGLRQLCDFAVILHVCAEAERNGGNRKEWVIDKEELKRHLEELGYWKAYKAVGALVVDVLGLPEEDFPFAITEKDRKWVKPILRNVMASGNFGRSRRKVKKLGLLHSIESGWLTLRQAWTFYRLAPREVFGRGLDLTGWFLERFKIKRENPEVHR